MSELSRVDEAIDVLRALGMPRAQQNERSALCLLALLDLTPDRAWKDAAMPLLGITPIMEWSYKHYGRKYAPNTRETFRRQTIHQFVSAGLAVYNPDDPNREVNSPRAVYQISAEARALLRRVGRRDWPRALEAYLLQKGSLAASYARDRQMVRIPIRLGAGKKIDLSTGAHSQLIKAVVEAFAPRFAPGSSLVYVGDTGNKWAYFDQARLARLGVRIDAHGKMPDVIIHDRKRGWLLLVEAVTSHGPVDGKRHEELASLFVDSKAGLVFITAFQTRAVMARYLPNIAWETEVWVAEAPSHLIHFNGERFLGPYR